MGLLAADKGNDLVVESIEVSPVIPAINQKCIVTVKVKNIGDYGLRDNTGLSDFKYNFTNFHENKKTYALPTIDKFLGLQSYINYTFEGYFTKSASSTSLSFEIDSGNKLDEKDEKNNKLQKNIEVLSTNSLDIAIDSIEFSPKDLVVFKPVDIAVKIKNKGKQSLTSLDGLVYERPYQYPTDEIYFSLPNFVISSSSRSIYPTVATSLKQNDIFTYTFSGKFIEVGKYDLLFSVDTKNRLIEIDELNNSTNTPIIIYNEDEVGDFLIYGVESQAISSSSFKVKWKTDKKTIGGVQYRDKTFAFFEQYKATKEIKDWPSDTSSSTIHEITVKNVTPATEYEFRVYGKYTNKEIYGLRSLFSTPYSDNLVLSTVPIHTVNQLTSLAIIDWQTNLISNSAVYYKKASDLTYISTTSLEAVINHSMLLDGLSPAEYYFYVMSSSTLQATSTVVTSVKSDIYRFVIDNSEVEADTDDSVDDNTDGRNIIPMIARDSALYERLKGSIVLRVDDHGEAWYLNPLDDRKYYLGRPDDAFNIMKGLAIGITNKDLAKIPIAGEHLPLNWRSSLDYIFTRAHKGKIFLQVEGHGEAWYVNPTDEKRYYLGRPADAFQIMRDLSIGVTSVDFKKL